MKVLFVLSSMSIGGLEVFTASLAKKLVENENEAGVLIFKSYDKGVNLLDDNRIKIYFAGRKGCFDFLFLSNVHKSIKNFQPDIIFSLSDFAYFFVEFLQRAHRIDVPHILAFSSFRPFTFREAIFSKIFIYFSKLWHAYYAFVSYKQYEFNTGFYRIPKSRSFVIHYGVDISYFTPGDYKKSDIFTVIHIANIYPEKDQLTLLKALSKFNENINDWRLIFIGRDKCNLLKKFKIYLKEKNIIKNILFVGNAGRKSIGEFLSSSHVFVLSSFTEGLPLSSLEAMAVGVPCILTDVGGCSEIVTDGYNGYLVKSGDYKAIAEKLLYLYKNSELLEQMGRNARKKAIEEFNLDNCLEKYLDFFAKIV